MTLLVIMKAMGDIVCRCLSAIGCFAFKLHWYSGYTMILLLLLPLLLLLLLPFFSSSSLAKDSFSLKPQHRFSLYVRVCLNHMCECLKLNAFLFSIFFFIFISFCKLPLLEKFLLWVMDCVRKKIFFFFWILSSSRKIIFFFCYFFDTKHASFLGHLKAFKLKREQQIFALFATVSGRNIFHGLSFCFFAISSSTKIF